MTSLNTSMQSPQKVLRPSLFVGDARTNVLEASKGGAGGDDTAPLSPRQSATMITKAAQLIFSYTPPLVVFFVRNPDIGEGEVATPLSTSKKGGSSSVSNSADAHDQQQVPVEVERVMKRMEEDLHEVDASSVVVGDTVPGASVSLHFAKASHYYHHGGASLHVFLILVPRRTSGFTARVKRAALVAKEWRDELVRTGAGEANLLIFLLHQDLLDAGKTPTATSGAGGFFGGDGDPSPPDAPTTATVLKSAATFFGRLGSSKATPVEEAMEAIQEYQTEFSKRISNMPRLCVYNPYSYKDRICESLKDAYHQQALTLKALRHQSLSARYAPGWSLQGFWRCGYDLALHHLRFGALHEAISSFSTMFTEYYNHSDDFGFLDDWSYLRDVGQLVNVLDPRRRAVDGSSTATKRLGYPSPLGETAEVIDGLLYIVGAEMTCALFLGNREGALARFSSLYEVIKEKFAETNREDVVTSLARAAQHTPTTSVDLSGVLGDPAHRFPPPPAGSIHHMRVDSNSLAASVASVQRKAAPPMYLQHFFLFRCIMSALDLCTGSDLAARVGSFVQHSVHGGFVGIDGTTANATARCISPSLASHQHHDEQHEHRHHRRQHKRQPHQEGSGGGVVAPTTSATLANDSGAPLVREETAVPELSAPEGVSALLPSTGGSPLARDPDTDSETDTASTSSHDTTVLGQLDFTLLSLENQDLLGQSGRGAGCGGVGGGSTTSRTGSVAAQREYHHYCVAVGDMCLAARQHLIELASSCGFPNPSSIVPTLIRRDSSLTMSLDSIPTGAMPLLPPPLSSSSTHPHQHHHHQRSTSSLQTSTTRARTSSPQSSELRKWLGLECIRSEARYHTTFLSMTRVAASALRKGKRNKHSHALMVQEAATLLAEHPYQAVDVLYRVVLPYYQSTGWQYLLRHAEGLLVHGVRRLLAASTTNRTLTGHIASSVGQHHHERSPTPQQEGDNNGNQAAPSKQQHSSLKQQEDAVVPKEWYRAALHYALDRALTDDDDWMNWCRVFCDLQQASRSAATSASTTASPKSSSASAPDDVEEFLMTVDTADNILTSTTRVEPMLLSYVLHRRIGVGPTTTFSESTIMSGQNSNNIATQGRRASMGNTASAQTTPQQGSLHAAGGAAGVSWSSDVSKLMGSLVTDRISISCVRKSTTQKIMHHLRRCDTSGPFGGHSVTGVPRMRGLSYDATATMSVGGGGSQQASPRMLRRRVTTAVSVNPPPADDDDTSMLESYTKTPITTRTAIRKTTADSASAQQQLLLSAQQSGTFSLQFTDSGTFPAFSSSVAAGPWEDPNKSGTFYGGASTTDELQNQQAPLNLCRRLPPPLPRPRWLPRVAQPSVSNSLSTTTTSTTTVPELPLDEPAHVVVMVTCTLDLMRYLVHLPDPVNASLALHSKKAWSVSSEPVHVVEFTHIPLTFDAALQALVLIVPFTPCHAGSYRVATLRINIGELPLIQHFRGGSAVVSDVFESNNMVATGGPTEGGNLHHHMRKSTNMAAAKQTALSNNNNASAATAAAAAACDAMRADIERSRCTLFVVPEPAAGIELSVVGCDQLLPHCFGDSTQHFELEVAVTEPLRPAAPVSVVTEVNGATTDNVIVVPDVNASSPKVTPPPSVIGVEHLRVECRFEGGTTDGLALVTGKSHAAAASTPGGQFLHSPFQLHRRTSTDGGEVWQEEPLAQVRIGRPPRRERSGRVSMMMRGGAPHRNSTRPRSPTASSAQRCDDGDFLGQTFGAAASGGNLSFIGITGGGGVAGGASFGFSSSVPMPGGVSFQLPPNDEDGHHQPPGAAVKTHRRHPLFGSLSAALRSCLADWVPLDQLTVFSHSQTTKADWTITYGGGGAAGIGSSPLLSLSSGGAANNNSSIGGGDNPLHDNNASILLLNGSSNASGPQFTPPRGITATQSDGIATVGTGTFSPHSAATTASPQAAMNGTGAADNNMEQDATLRYIRGASATIVANKYIPKLKQFRNVLSNVEGETLDVDGTAHEGSGFTTLNLFASQPTTTTAATGGSNPLLSSTIGGGEDQPQQQPSLLTATKLTMRIPLFPSHMKSDQTPLTFACHRNREISMRHTSLKARFAPAFEVKYEFTPFQDRVFVSATVRNVMPAGVSLWIRHAVLHIFAADAASSGHDDGTSYGEATNENGDDAASMGYYVYSTPAANARNCHKEFCSGDHIAFSFELRLHASYQSVKEIVRHGVRLCMAYSLWSSYESKGVPAPPPPLPRSASPHKKMVSAVHGGADVSLSTLVTAAEENAKRRAEYNTTASLCTLHEATSCNIHFSIADHFTSKHLCVFNVMLFVDHGNTTDDVDDDVDTTDRDEDDDEDALSTASKSISASEHDMPPPYGGGGMRSRNSHLAASPIASVVDDTAMTDPQQHAALTRRDSVRSVFRGPSMFSHTRHSVGAPHGRHPSSGGQNQVIEARGLHEVGEPVNFIAMIQAQPNNWPAACNPDGHCFLLSVEVDPTEWMVLGRVRYARVLSRNDPHQLRFTATPIGRGVAVTLPSVSIRRLEYDADAAETTEGEMLAVDVVKARASLRLKRTAPMMALKNETLMLQ